MLSLTYPAMTRLILSPQMLSFLPPKMRTDIAMRVHYRTLMKVKLFRNCDPGLVKALVVLLRPIIYLPGDHICRKDDRGKEGRG